jgi:regulator of sigma D
MSAVMQLNPERRQYNQHLVTELQEERHQVWSLYCKIGENKPFTCSSQTQSLLTQLSQLLIDYVSLGHFGIYEHLLSGTERRDSVLTAAKDIYPELSTTTESVIAFNDKYDDNKHLLNVDCLESDLSSLGENLAKRIELEDKLCRLILE